MGMNLKQNSDGSMSVIRDRDSAELDRIGGARGAAGSNTPSYEGGGQISFNIAGGTDTAGGLLQWQNTLGYDIIVTGAQLDVTTQSSAACTVSFGEASAGGVSASNMINAQSVASTGTFNGGALSVKVTQNQWITGSKASGATGPLVASFIAQYTRSPAAGGI